MKTRRASVIMAYNGADATGSINPELTSFTYTDVASGSSDSINVELTDPEKRWLNAWFPEKGDKLVPSISTQDWGIGGGSFQCGTFMIDDFSFSGGPPVRLSISALAVPTESSFKTTKRTITYEDATLQEIAQEVADRAGVSLEYEADSVDIDTVEQNKQTDLEFVSNLVKDNGLCIKIYNEKIVIFDIAKYEAKGPKLTLTPLDFEPGWSFNSTLEGIYTGVKYQYTDNTTGCTYTVEAGDGDRILTADSPTAANLSEAMRYALSAVNEANRSAQTISVTIMAQPGLIATDCIQISGLGKIDGKYYVEQIEHSVGSGYKMAITAHRVVDPISSITNTEESYE